MKKVLVTGISGYIGQHCAVELLKDGFSHETEASTWIKVLFIFNMVTLFGTLIAVDFLNLGFEIYFLNG